MEEPEEELTNFSVIKCSINNKLKPYLSNEFIKLLKHDSLIMGKMYRRSSLFLNYYIKHCIENNINLPNFFKLPLTEWKNILKIGLIEYNKPFPSIISMKNLYNRFVNEQLIEETIFQKPLENNSDQKITYSSVQFKTVFINNIKVHFQIT